MLTISLAAISSRVPSLEHTARCTYAATESRLVLIWSLLVKYHESILVYIAVAQPTATGGKRTRARLDTLSGSNLYPARYQSGILGRYKL